MDPIEWVDSDPVCYVVAYFDLFGMKSSSIAVSDVSMKHARDFLLNLFGKTEHLFED